jgi:hypothetical protein
MFAPGAKPRYWPKMALLYMPAGGTSQGWAGQQLEKGIERNGFLESVSQQGLLPGAGHVII